MQRKDFTTVLTLGYSLLGEKWSQMGTVTEANMADFEKAVEISELGEKLLVEGRVKGHLVDLRDGGLRNMIQGLEDLRRGNVSAKKIVGNGATMSWTL